MHTDTEGEKMPGKSNAERQAAFRERLKARGFERITVVVHRDDRARVQSFAAALRDVRNGPCE